MFNRVLVAVDGSDESRAAVKMAAKLAVQGMVQEIIMLHVFYGSNSGNSALEAERVGYTLLEQEGVALQEVSVHIINKVIEGEPANSICGCASANHCTLILMGSRGSSQLKGLLLGSVSTKVLQYANCPVLIVKEEGIW